MSDGINKKWRLQISLRDGLWIITTLSICAAWFVHHARERAHVARLESDLDQLTREVMLWQTRAEHVVKVIKVEGWDVRWSETFQGSKMENEIWISGPRSQLRTIDADPNSAPVQDKGTLETGAESSKEDPFRRDSE